MYYVIQVAPGAEEKTEALIKKRLAGGLFERCFHPVRHVRKKIRGEWKDLHEKLIPGYVFLISDSIREVSEALRKVPMLTKLLGREEDEVFTPLPDHEAAWLEKLTAEGSEIPLSQISVSEGDDVTILAGPLKDMAGRIRKINLHKRTAEVEVDFMNQGTILYLGIELVKKE